MEITKKTVLVVGVALAVGLLLSGWFIFALLKAEPGIQSGILALIGVTTSGIIAHNSAKKREIEARHFAEKREGYKAFINFIVGMFMAKKLGKQFPKEKELLSEFVEYKKILLIWADADIIKTWNETETSFVDVDNKSSEEILLIWDKMLRAIRKDLGKDDSQLGDLELISVLLSAEDKVGNQGDNEDIVVLSKELPQKMKPGRPTQPPPPRPMKR